LTSGRETRQDIGNSTLTESIMPRCSFVAALVWLVLLSSLTAETREEKVRNDRKKVEATGFWIYNDLPKAKVQAKKSGKPMLVVLRCIPCVECVKLDDDLLDQDKRVRPLLEKFVRVRVVSTNGLDLSLFQFDTDQSFAVFLCNADGAVYGRFGTRSHRTVWQDDVSVEGLAKALAGALELHAGYPGNKSELAKKKGAASDFPVPEKFPLLKGRYGSSLDYSGNVVGSCIHCHQIGDAQRQYHRTTGKPFPETILFPHPHPKAIGLILDPKERATVKRVDKDSPADRAGFKAGDVLVKLEGQTLLSIADVQWVLHRADPAGAKLKAEVKRGDKTKSVTLSLPKGWRQKDDVSWRASSWGLRRMATGGMLLQPTTPEERKKRKIEEGQMALRVAWVGLSAPHDGARRAGIQREDILVSFDDRTDLVRETDVLYHSLTRKKSGDKIKVAVVRGGKKMKMGMMLQP
jgi:hypothetical protein